MRSNHGSHLFGIAVSFNIELGQRERRLEVYGFEKPADLHNSDIEFSGHHIEIARGYIGLCPRHWMDAYRRPVHRLDRRPDGLVRAGCACYTTEEEVERLVDGVKLLLV